MSGVSFELTEEQRELQALAHEFAERELRPIAAECDEGGVEEDERHDATHDVLGAPHVGRHGCGGRLDGRVHAYSPSAS